MGHKKAAETKRKNAVAALMASEFEMLSVEAKKKRLLLEANGLCMICGVGSWMNQPLRLQLDHIDGFNGNNRRSNLRVICPNCHSQTPTYCGRYVSADNPTGKKYEVSDETLLEALRTCPTISSALKKAGYGTNTRSYYTRCRKLLVEHNITLM